MTVDIGLSVGVTSLFVVGVTKFCGFFLSHVVLEGNGKLTLYEAYVAVAEISIQVDSYYAIKK